MILGLVNAKLLDFLCTLKNKSDLFAYALENKM